MTTERDRRNQEAFKVNKAHAEGRQERNLEIVQNLLADGMPVEKVSQYTGLSVDEIKKQQQQ